MDTFPHGNPNRHSDSDRHAKFDTDGDQDGHAVVNPNQNTHGNGDARRLVEQNGVRLDGAVLSDARQPFPGAGVLQVRKRRFVRVKLA